MSGCAICAKHRDPASVPGGELAADVHAVVTHLAPAGEDDAVYLGYLFVEPRRHVAELADLTAGEAGSVGRLAARAAGALRTGAGAEHVYAAIIGHGLEHLHVHVIARYPGTPREFWWTRVDESPGAPRGSAVAVDALAGRLRAALAVG
jgi:diadenosine tetraphosphate (Ap4A) HIT family hydrolase